MGVLRTISQSAEPFADREEAGIKLADELLRLPEKAPVVLGIPRGGVVVARRIALRLGADMDIMLSRKIGAPGNPELAIGAVSEDGRLFLDAEVIDRMGNYKALQGYIERERDKQYALIKDRIERYRSIRRKVPLKGRPVIITDDGIATGATMQACLWAARREGPGRVIVAVPVASIDALNRISTHADETIALKAPLYFYAVGQFYMNFEEVTDDQVAAVLQEQAKSDRS